MTYPVTTIGDVGGAPCSACAASRFGCGAQGCSRRASMGALEDLTGFVNPLAWLASQVGKKVAEKLTGKGDSPPDPTAIDLLAKELGIDPIELVISVAGFSGWGKFWPSLKVAGGIVALGGAAFAASRLLSSRQPRPKKGKK